MGAHIDTYIHIYKYKFTCTYIYTYLHTNIYIYIPHLVAPAASNGCAQWDACRCLAFETRIWLLKQRYGWPPAAWLCHGTHLLESCHSPISCCRHVCVVCFVYANVLCIYPVVGMCVLCVCVRKCIMYISCCRHVCVVCLCTQMYCVYILLYAYVCCVFVYAHVLCIRILYYAYLVYI